MKPGVFREEYIAIIVRELLRGLDYLHTEGKLHRDIKGHFASLLIHLILMSYHTQLPTYCFPQGVMSSLPILACLGSFLERCPPRRTLLLARHTGCRLR
jgi:serine/threonine protein kinase